MMLQGRQVWTDESAVEQGAKGRSAVTQLTGAM